MNRSAAAWWDSRGFNLSFGANRSGSLGGLDRYYGWLVQWSWRTVVPAAGCRSRPLGTKTFDLAADRPRRLYIAPSSADGP